MYLFELWFSPDGCAGLGLLNHMVILFLVFQGISILFSIVVVPVYIPTNSEGVFLFLQTLSSIYCWYGHSGWCKVVPHSSLICISLKASDVEHIFSCAFWPSVCLLWRNVCLDFCSFFLFLGPYHIIWKFPGQGSNQNCRCQPMPQPQHQVQAMSETYTTAHKTPDP